MPLNTTPVAGYLYDPSGAPLANTPVLIRLTRPEIEDNIVVPEVITANTDETGLLTVDLWPNTRGTAGSQYRLTVKQWGTAGERKVFDRLLTVPESIDPVNLAELFDSDPPDTVSTGAALRAAAEAEATLATVQSLADQTAADRTTVQVLAGEAANSATTALTSVSQSVAAAQLAGDKADEATVQADLAAQHAANAAASVLQVDVVAGDVEAAKLAAEAAATVSTNAAAVSEDARDVAVDAALDAFQNSVDAQLAQINAEAAELAALGHATGAQLALLGAEAERLAAESAANNASADAIRAESAADEAEASVVLAQDAVSTVGALVADAETAANESEAARDESAVQAGLSAASASAAAASAVESENSALASAASAAEASGFADDAEQSKLGAEAAEASAGQILNDVVLALGMNGNIFATAQDAINTIGEMMGGEVFVVLKDETFGGRRTFNKVEPPSPSIYFDFVPEQTELEALNSPSLSFDFVTGAYSVSQFEAPREGVTAFGAPYVRIGADSINVVDFVPEDSNSPGIKGDISINGLNYDFHNGTQWVRLTGSTF